MNSKRDEDFRWTFLWALRWKISIYHYFFSLVISSLFDKLCHHCHALLWFWVDRKEWMSKPLTGTNRPTVCSVWLFNHLLMTGSNPIILFCWTEIFSAPIHSWQLRISFYKPNKISRIYLALTNSFLNVRRSCKILSGAL